MKGDTSGGLRVNKNSYDRREYESVDEKSLSYAMFFRQYRVNGEPILSRLIKSRPSLLLPPKNSFKVILTLIKRNICIHVCVYVVCTYLNITVVVLEYLLSIVKYTLFLSKSFLCFFLTKWTSIILF